MLSEQNKKGTIYDEMLEINNKLLQTSLDVVLDPAEGNMVCCACKNVCFPNLLGPQGGGSSEKVKFEYQLALSFKAEMNNLITLYSFYGM